MQYLTEVRKSKAFVGEKVELKLLAKNTADNNWLAINVDQIIPVNDSNLAKDFKDGQLALADLAGTNNEIKSLQDASRRLVQTLQNFGKFQEKFKAGEQEIEQWKQSLTFQTQEVQRREIDVEERERYLEQLEARKEEMEAQLDKFDREREEVMRMREEVRVKEAAFAQRATALSAEQAQELRDLVKQLSNSSFPALETKINNCLDMIYQRQEVLNEFWRELEGQRSKVSQAQQEVEGAKRHLDGYLLEWKQVQSLLIETQSELKLRKEQLQPKENIAQILRTAYQAQTELHQSSSEALVQLSGSTGLLAAAEVKRLQAMPIQELEEIITASQAELDKALNFVNLQEDELAAIEGDIAEISNRIIRANEFEKLELEAEKESLEEEYRAQENSLQGQRRGIQERESILEQQRRILEKRMGSDTIDPLELFRPIVLELDTLQQQAKESLDALQKQIESDRMVIKQQENLVGDQRQLQQQKQQELKAAEEQLTEKIRLLAEAEGKLNSLEQILRPVQDILDGVRPLLEAARAELGQGQGNSDALQQLEQKINALMDA